MTSQQARVILITGAAKRIGAEIARTCHEQGFNVMIHYHQSAEAATQLVDELNQIRPNTASSCSANLAEHASLKALVDTTVNHFSRLDALINNASSFYPTKLAEATEQQWDELFNHNAKGAYFLSQQAAPHLKASLGQIINITDIHAEQPLKNYSIYCAAKAALAMLSRCCAKDLAPIRVNCIAPGAILWPEGEATLDNEQKQNILDKIPLRRAGNPSDIAATALWLLQHGEYITGQTLHVAGGRQ